MSSKNISKIKKDLENIKNKINLLNHHYYVLDSPLVSDHEYDIEFQKLVNLEESYPNLVSNDSPSQRIGDQPLSKFESVNHKEKMLSLNKGNISEVFGVTYQPKTKELDSKQLEGDGEQIETTVTEILEMVDAVAQKKQEQE